MPIHEQRQLFRIDDQIYFDYKVINVPNQSTNDEELFGQNGKRYIEATQYFQNIDYEMSQLTQNIAMEEPAVAHFLNLMNAKIEFLTRMILLESKLQLHKVNLSIGGIAFKTETQLKNDTYLKLVIYTKPKMTPIILNGHVVSSAFVEDNHYRTAVQFEKLTHEQEDALAQHIMQAQIKSRLDMKSE